MVGEPNIFPLWRFRNKSLLRQVLTHKSANTAKNKNNERLEWLGDSLLEFLIAQELYNRYPRLSEGVLSHARTRLVKGTTLSSLAREVGLDKHVKTDKGCSVTDSIMAGVMEACLAAVYLEGGMDAAEAVVGELFNDKLNEIDDMLASKSSLNEPKGELQKKALVLFSKVPEYQTQSSNLSAAHSVHIVECRVGDDIVALGEGKTVRAAEQNAAEKCLKMMPKKKRGKR